MNKNSNNNNLLAAAVCSDPAVGSLLPDYIVDLLDDTVAFEVEQHLVDCRSCKQRYLTVLRARGVMSKKVEPSVGSNGIAESVGPFGEFELRKHRP